MNNFYNENGNPFIQSNVGMVGFGVSNVVAFDLSATNNVTLAGGLQDDDAATATLQEFIPEVWGASIMDYMEKSLVFGKLSNDLSALVAGGGDLIHLPRHSELTASDTYGSSVVETLIDGNLAFAKTGDAEDDYTLSVNQGIHTAIGITDVAKVQAGYDVMNMYTKKMGYALGKKIDFFLAKLLYQAVTFNDEANGGVDGASSANLVTFTGAGSYDISVAGVSNMIKAIYEADASIEDYTLVLAPATYASLFKLGDFARYDGTGIAGDSNPLISGFAGKLGGVPVVISNNIVNVVASSGAYTQSSSPVFNSADARSSEVDHLAGYLIHKDAMHVAFAQGMKARVQSDYHLPSLSTRFVADSVFGGLITSSATVPKVFALTDA